MLSVRTLEQTDLVNDGQLMRCLPLMSASSGGYDSASLADSNHAVVHSHDRSGTNRHAQTSHPTVMV